MSRKENTSSSSSLSSFQLTVRVTEGRGLAAKDPNGRSDPYCLIGLPSLSNSQEFQDSTKCIRSETQFWNLSPTWKKAIFSSGDDQIRRVRVEVWDKDYGKNDDFMGYAILEIDSNSNNVDKWVPLLARSPADGVVTGEIHILISQKGNQKSVNPVVTTKGPEGVTAKQYSEIEKKETKQSEKENQNKKAQQEVERLELEKKEQEKLKEKETETEKEKEKEKEKEIEGVLRVRMLSASGVPPVDETNTSDPYCIVGLTNNEDGQGSNKWIGEYKRTKVVCSTCNPSWDEEALFEFKILYGPSTEVQKLMIEVWDKANVDSADVLLGKVVLPLEEITKRTSTTLYKPQLVIDPKVKESQDASHVTLLSLSCLYIPANSTSEEDEWMLPRHERPIGKAMMNRAEQLMLSKQKNSKDAHNDSTYTDALQGKLKEGMQSRLVRVFVSSTFTDTEKERNLLMEDVYPFMQRLCKVLGMEFETVDMRWGVRQETTLSHNTSNLCMSEIEKCVTKSFGPSFLCILGDKYGYRPFPANILKETLDEMWKVLCEQKIAQLKAENSSYEVIEEMMNRGIEGTRNWEPEKWTTQTPLAHIPRCFKLDYNMKQLNYVLESRFDVGLADDKLWWPIFEDLQKMLRRAARVLSNKEEGKAPDEETAEMHGEWRKFEISVTEEEVHNGILGNKKREDQSIVILRKIIEVENLDNSVKRNYVDVVAANAIDTEAVNLLALLKNHVRDSYDKSSGKESNVVELGIKHIELNPTKDLTEEGIKYRKTLCDTICGHLAGKLLTQFDARVKIASPLYDEVVRHLSFREEKLEIYVERPEIHQKIIDYLTTDQKQQLQTLVIQAPSGAGKTALMAWASKWASTNISSSFVITRFLGTSPQSSDVLSLLQSLCYHLIELLHLVKPQADDGRNEDRWVIEGRSVMQLSSLLKLLMKEFESTNKILVIFLDSLDQLSPAYGAHMLHWLPLLVPFYVRIVVSVLIPPATANPDSLDSSMLMSRQLHSLSTGTLNEFTIQDMGLNIAEEVLKQVLGSKQRTVTEGQKDIVISAFKRTPMPLYLQVAFTIAQVWHSYTPLDQCILEDGMRGIIYQVFTKLEKKHGELLISRALSYLIESRNGLSSPEMENILSCDEDVLSDIFEWWTPPVRRLPPLLWKRILEDLGKFVVERGVHGVTVNSLYHRQFREAAKARYVTTIEQEKKIAAHLAKFFNGDFSTPRLVPFINKKAGGVVQAEDRLIEPQPVRYSSVQFNRRKLSELPYLQTKSGDFRSLSSSLFSFEFIEAKAEAGMLDELEEDYETARLAILRAKENDANNDKNEKESIAYVEGLLNQFSRFVRNKRHIIRRSPKDTLMHAVNGPNVLEITKLANEQWTKNAVHSQKVIYKCVNKSPSEDPCIMTLVESGMNGGLDSCHVTRDFSVLLAGTFDNNIKLWNLQNGQEILTLSGHSHMIKFCFFSPDESKIISGSTDKTIRIWDKLTGHQQTIIPLANFLRSLTITKDGSKLIAGIDPEEVLIIDVNSGNILSTFKSEAKVCDVVLSPDEQLVAFVEYYGEAIFVYELNTGKLLHNIKKPKSKGIVFTPDNHLIFGDGTLLKRWDITENKFYVFGEHRNPISACTVNGNTVVSASNEGVLVVWDLSNGRRICSMRGHSHDVFRVLTDGTKVISGSQDNSLKVWDIATAVKQFYSSHSGKVILCKPVKRGIKTMAVMCAEGDFFKAWDIENGNCVHEFRNIVGFSPVVSNDGRFLAAVDTVPQEHVAVWDLAVERIIKTFPHDLEIISVSFSPNASRLLTFWGDYPATATVWDVVSGDKISSFDIGDEAKLEFLDENRLLYYQLITQCNGDTPSTANVVDVVTTKTLCSFQFFMDMSLRTQVRNGVIVVSTDTQIKVWDSASQQVLYERFTDRSHAFNGSPVLTERGLWVSDKFGVVRMVDVKEWKEREKHVVVDGEIAQMFGIENRLVICCNSGDVFFMEV